MSSKTGNIDQHLIVGRRSVGIAHTNVPVIERSEHRAHMQRQNRVHIINYSILHHRLCSAGSFFRRLENKFYLSLKLILMVLQHHCCRNEHRRMSVMAAGVHILICRSICKTSLFLYGKSVHIGPDRNCFPLTLANHSRYS